MKNAILLSLILPSLMYAQYTTPGTGVHWNLDSLVVHSGGVVTFNTDHYEIAQDLTVATMDTLSIVTDETVRIASARLLTFAGVLRVDPPTQAVFTALDTTQNFKGLRFENTPASVVRHATIEFGGGTKLVGSSMLFDQCIVRKNNSVYASGGIDVFQCDATITHCEIYRNARAGISSAANAGSSPQILYNSIFENNTSNGNYPQINLGSGGSDSIRIVGNTILGLYDRAGGIALSTLAGGSSVVAVRENVIANNRYGIACLGNNVHGVISHNVVDGNNIEGNPMAGGSGLNFYSTTLSNDCIVTRNVITGNLWGITIQGQASPRMGDLSNEYPHDDGANFIYGNGNGGVTFGLYNNTPVSQKAENNYWGVNTADSVEMVIFHQADSAVLGPVDYNPILTVETFRHVHMEVGPLTGLGDSILVGLEAFGGFTVRNRGDQDLRISIKDTSGFVAARGIRQAGTALGVHPKTSLGRALDHMRALKPMIGPDHSSAFFANDSMVVYDPANDFLGRPTNTNGLIFPDVLKVTVKFGTFILPYADVEVYFNGVADTTILGVMSWDTDQDFMTGLYPPLANLGLAPTDVGSEYEMVFTTSPTLSPVPAFMFASTDTSYTPVAAATSLTRSGPKVTFRLYAVPSFSFDHYPNVNAACGFLSTEGINALLGSDSSFTPSHIPDAAPDIGHMRRGVETNPSWLSFDVKSDTLAGDDSVRVLVRALGSRPAGTYDASIVITSNDSAAQRVTIPVPLTMVLPPQPQVNIMDLAVSDTIHPNSGIDIPVVLTNSGLGDFLYFVLDTAGIPWLRIEPMFGTISAGESELFTISLFDSGGLSTGNYLAHVLVVSNDTSHVILSVPIQMVLSPVNDIANHGRPHHFFLEQNHPNPFNPGTVIRYGLAEAARIEVAVFNVLGQKVRTLVRGTREAGAHYVIWDGRNDRGEPVSSGVYFCRVAAGDAVKTRRMLLLK